MKTYKNKQEGFKAIQKRSLRLSIPLMLLAMIFGLGFGFGNSNNGEVNTLPYLILPLLGAGAFGIFRGLNRQRKIFESYVLIVGEDFIQREQMLTSTITIKKDELKEIIKYQNSSFIIRGEKKEDLIIVNELIENHEDLESNLRIFGEVKEEAIKATTQKLLLPIVILVLGLMAVVYLSTNKYLVLISGTILTFGFIWSLYKTQTSKNIDNKTKRASWWIVIVLISIIAITYTKVMN